MQRGRLGEVLSGGYIEDYNLDLRHNSLLLDIGVLDEGERDSYEVVFEKVSHFEFDTESRSDAGDKLQVTEFWVDVGPEQSSSEEWGVAISIFDLSHVRLRCSVIHINGERVK